MNVPPPTAARSSQLLDQLQAALVPRARIDPRWGVAWRYRPSDDQMRIGGDFLGILERHNGSLAMIVGDVAGRGAEAAGLGATLRSAWLGMIHAGVSIDAIPAALDRLLEHHSKDRGVFATACFAELDRSAGEIRVIRAGHDPPLLITPQAATALDAGHSPALGLGVPRDSTLARIRLPRPAAILLYTDGLTESRKRPGEPRLGIQGLVAQIEPSRLVARPALEALDELLATSLPAGGIGDDLAVILVSPTASGRP